MHTLGSTLGSAPMKVSALSPVVLTDGDTMADEISSLIYRGTARQGCKPKNAHLTTSPKEGEAQAAP